METPESVTFGRNASLLTSVTKTSGSLFAHLNLQAPEPMLNTVGVNLVFRISLLGKNKSGIVQTFKELSA